MENELNKIPVDPHTQKRIHEHLANEKDIITEEDLKKVDTDINKLQEEETPDLQSSNPGSAQHENEEATGHKKIKENTDPSPHTSGTF